MLAVDFGGTKVDLAIASGAGEFLEVVRIATLAEQGPDRLVERAGRAARELAGRAGRAHHVDVVGCAAVSPGVVRDDCVLFSPNLPGWAEVALAGRLEAELGLGHVAVGNDVRAGALAELLAGALRDAEPGVYVSLGTGLAAALTTGGRVLGGAHGAAGEIAYTCGDPMPLLAAADGYAPLEEQVGGKALGIRASRLFGRPVTAAELFALDDPAATRLVRDAVGALAVAIANIAVFTDPQRVVIGGGLAWSFSAILPIVSAHLSRTVPFPPEVVPARFANRASLHGAVALAVHARLSSLTRVPQAGPARGDAEERAGALTATVPCAPATERNSACF